MGGVDGGLSVRVLLLELSVGSPEIREDAMSPVENDTYPESSSR